ncbi:MAG: hypothetical protein M1823_001967 [Watsoniomyces obsoletus]|nr:MAG: hypothetical protein M1823_001967 [Watsoniomyces obsoletus]
MADGKRASTGSKFMVATPNIGNPVSSTVPLETALVGCIGAKIRVTTILQEVVEGILFTADPLTNLVAICSNPSSPATSTSSALTPLSGDYHIIPISKLQSFQLLSLASEPLTPASASDPAVGNGVPGGLGKIDWTTAQERERKAVEQEMKREQSMRQEVGRTPGQEVYDVLNRSLPVRWQDQSIIVLDAVEVRPPYGLEDCRAVGKDTAALQRVKKVLETENKRKNGDRNGPKSSGAPTTHPAATTAAGLGTSNATSRSVTPSSTISPAVPTPLIRKGG